MATVFIDADACPVTREAISAARREERADRRIQVGAQAHEPGVGPAHGAEDLLEFALVMVDAVWGHACPVMQRAAGWAAPGITRGKIRRI